MGAILAMKHDVTVLCGDAPEGTVEAPAIIEGMKVIRVRTLRSPRLGAGGFLRASPNPWLMFRPVRFLKDLVLFPDTHRPWAERAIRVMRRLGHNSTDMVVVTSSPVSSPHVAMLKFKSRVPVSPFWVMDLRDPWTTAPCRYWPQKWPGFLHRYEVAVEARCHGVAGLVTVIGERMRRSLRTEFGSDPVVVYNGYSEPLDGFQKAGSHGVQPCLIRYCGKIIPGLRSPELLFAVAASLNLKPETIRFEFWCNEPQLVLRCAADHGVSSLVSCFNHVQRADCVRLEEAASANVVLNGITPGADYILTGKVFELIGLRRPVLAVTGCTSELREILENCGSFLNVWDLRTAKDALLAVLSERASPPFDKKRAYSRKTGTATFLDALNRRMSNGKQR